MSLTDLKKTKDGKAKKKSFTIDEFISDAENYAKGDPKIVTTVAGAEADHKLNLQEAIAEAKRFIELKEKEHQSAEQQSRKRTKGKTKGDKPFRRATFTLSEDAIDQLHELSAESDLAKSHILRILIDELCNKEQNEQLKKLLQSKID
ncbi:hypothetical protein [Litorilituus lipolyticus]|uniref:Ribbon-helix-helix protein, CopG family n=1 Tax=Litorilituus lipolyticus TaxID=2491017 RepID=A0A502KNR9_9GAMM|nr:hypothetical protein [Litorilituus lipolyticus]TPH13350.1 hypothetical protein EPA86_14260 [Litorilituus lipolyticus]